VEGSCEHGNEPSGSIKCWEILFRYTRTLYIYIYIYRTKRKLPSKYIVCYTTEAINEMYLDGDLGLVLYSEPVIVTDL
jgi:hypothetical protein